VAKKLTIKISESKISRFKESKTEKLLRIFKRIKLVRNLDLSQMNLQTSKWDFSVFHYIAKRMSKTIYLSMNEYKKRHFQAKGLVTSWPKYMKHLKSLCYDIKVETPSIFGPIMPDLPKKISFATDFLKYVPRLDTAKVTFPCFGYISQMDNLWKFEKYPASLRKLSFQSANYGQNDLKCSLSAMKNLRDLEIGFVLSSNPMLMKSVFNQSSQVAYQLRVLALKFEEEFKVETSICERLKDLPNLKKVKLQISLMIVQNNHWQVLECFNVFEVESYY